MLTLYGTNAETQMTLDNCKGLRKFCVAEVHTLDSCKSGKNTFIKETVRKVRHAMLVHVFSSELYVEPSMQPQWGCGTTCNENTKTNYVHM